MMTSFDIDGMLYGLLNGKTSINGAVYVRDERPEGLSSEDIAVNTISMEMDALPQSVTSNINIYVPDVLQGHGGGGNDRFGANGPRLKALADEVLSIVRAATIVGISLVPGDMSVMEEPESRQHFVNIRVDIISAAD